MPSIFQGTLLATCALIVIAMNCELAHAQSWPVNNPEVYEPVPQYDPGRYPLQPSQSPLQNPQSSVVAQPVQGHAMTIESLSPTASSPSDIATSAPAVDSVTSKSNRNQVNWDIYRDRNTTPIDPRKPCNVCTHPAVTHPGCRCNLPGINGRPYREHEPGGCQCGTKNPTRHPEFSVHWPRPFSAKLGTSDQSECGSQKKRIVDVFDPLSTFKLSKYKRTDNGYCGPGSDPYGCLGESKQASRVAGVGYRFPSEPVSRGPVSVFND